MLLPGKVSTTITPVKALDSGQLSRQDAIVLDTTIVDGTSNLASNISAAFKAAKRVPMGLVVCEDASGGVYVEANDPSRKVATAPVVTSAEDVDAGWDDSVLSIYKNGSLLTTEAGAGSAGSDTVAEWVAALNANAVFFNQCIASASGSKLVITGRDGGADQSLRVVSSDNADAYADATGAAVSEATAVGTSPLYAVVLDPMVELQDSAGTAKDAACLAAFSGQFDASELTSLTGEARAALVRQGSSFI